MKLKTILFAIIVSLVTIILFKNTEEATFWLFKEIHTSKLIILGVFFLLGVITGGVLFRRKKTHPKEYGVTNPYHSTEEEQPLPNLSDEDREYLGRD